MTLKVTESLDRLVRVRWAIPLVVAVAVAFLAVNETGYRRAQAGIRSAEAIYNKRIEVQRLLLLLQAAEAGQRGYLLTGQREYREPFEQAQAQLESQMSRIRAFFADDADSQGNVREIEDLARRKMSELRTTVSMFDSRNVDGALEVVKTGIGRDHMRALDELVTTMVADEDVKLAFAQQGLLETLLVSRAGIAALVLLGLLLLALTVRQSSCARRRARGPARPAAA